MRNLIFLVTGLFALTSCNRTKIEGKVVDPFGKPIKDISVTIEGTSFTDKTSSSGNYSIGYVPGGNIKVKFTKDGYADTNFVVNIATKSTFPAQQVAMYMIPDKEALYLISQDNYIPIKKGFFNKERRSSYYQTNDTYVTEITEDNFTVIKADPKIVFLDHVPKNISLVKLKFLNDNVYAIMERLSTFGDHSDGADVIKEDYFNYASKFHLTIRTPSSSLEPGYYAFIQRSNGEPAIEDSIYIFKVEEEKSDISSSQKNSSTSVGNSSINPSESIANSSVNSNDTQSPDELYEQALLYEKQQKYSEAISTLDKIYSGYPASKQASKAVFLEGFIYANVLNQLDKAKEKYELYLAKYSSVDAKMTEDVKRELRNMDKSSNEILKGIQEQQIGIADTTKQSK